MNYFAYKITDRLGRVQFTNGREMTTDEIHAYEKCEARGPFGKRDDALDAQLEWEGKPTWAQLAAKPETP